MSSVIVVGMQWGDEGKGKIVDIFTKFSDMVVRYSGGPNAGHTIVVDNDKLVVRLIPSGILHKNTTCVLSQGTVIDPFSLVSELNELDKRNISYQNSLIISDRAHVILPHHILVDTLREQSSIAIGTTKRGIGPCYEDKIARRGIMLGQFRDFSHAAGLVLKSCLEWSPIIKHLGGSYPGTEKTIKELKPVISRILPFIGNTSQKINEAIKQNKNVLFEGAQGTLLDIDHGTYPFVTSSNSIAGGACTGAGVGPSRINKVVGITKAYCTRVGSGPFPTELFDDSGVALRAAGNEFGSVTGRSRRTGWLDIPALKYAVDVNGIDTIAITKLDVLTGLDKIKVCVGYSNTNEFPINNLKYTTPIYKTFPGWSENITHIRNFEELPENAKTYIKFICNSIGCNLSLVSVGSQREETILIESPFWQI